MNVTNLELFANFYLSIISILEIQESILNFEINKMVEILMGWWVMSISHFPATIEQILISWKFQHIVLNFDINNIVDHFNCYQNTNYFNLLYQMLILKLPNCFNNYWNTNYLTNNTSNGIVMAHVIYIIATADAPSTFRPTQ